MKSGPGVVHPFDHRVPESLCAHTAYTEPLSNHFLSLTIRPRLRMPPKRKRDASLPPKGLLDQRLKLPGIPGAATSTPWGWVSTEVTDAARITSEHRLATCNFSLRGKNTICANKYSSGLEATRNLTQSKPAPVGELEEDIIVISDDDEPPSSCSKKMCRGNPNCLNYVGQEAWEDGGADCSSVACLS